MRGAVVAQRQPGKATRWQGASEIDFFLTNVAGIGEAVQLDVKVSDHIPIAVTIPLERHRLKEERWTGALDMGPKWEIPGFLSSEAWRGQVEKAWYELEEKGGLAKLERSLRQENAEVQDEWDLFNAALNACYRKAYENVIAEYEDTSADKEEAWVQREVQGMQKKLKTKGAKWGQKQTSQRSQGDTMRQGTPPWQGGKGGGGSGKRRG